MNLRVSIAAVGSAVLLIGSSGIVAWAAKSPAPTPATVTFRDFAGDGIKSDGQGAYVDNVKGSVCHIFTGGSEDLTVGTFQSGRTIQFFYTPASDVVQPSANPPSGSLVDNAFMNIRAIGAMQVGETRTTMAGFDTNVGKFQFNPNNGSLLVVVTRDSQSHWTVSTEASLPGAGDLDDLLQAYKNTTRVVGYYHMPFGLDVNCPTCPVPAP